ncbi:MAG: glycosyltransferase [Meiothermus sp.]|nr:glycosyltransferase [Meiothermus sp.]
MNTVTPKVSVVMPVYNAERFIDEAILSIRNQTLQDIELIIVNDESKDRSLEIAQHHATLDSRIRIIDQANAGIAAARNRGIATASGPYIALMDNDDISLPERLQQQYDFLQANPDVAVLGTYGTRIGEDGRELGVFEAGPIHREDFKRQRSKNEVIYLLGP